MTNKKIFPISLAVIGIVVILFSTGSSILTYDLFGIPAGNLIIWFGFISLQLAVYSFQKGFKASNSILGKLIRNLMRLLIGISILWFGIAYLLSGNLNFDFSSSATGYLGSPEASILYWNIIYALIVAPIVLMIAYSLLRYFERLKETK
ncbi:hypothetical protein [Winogradskyella alexanderae]|uniref:Uncharacterized protein n=1 Tax=Winogradskyella alexanderae TaxID=2877123 RepID=A0ABS7XTP4_9FLAO|nr:hypothetical protein [Winogradskyella alexanderae]MCA0133400.1 hypothetical protein [Winogradskyella alexanderae]